MQSERFFTAPDSAPQTSSSSSLIKYKMKFKELETTANVVWSPQPFYPVMLATGSAAQHVDSSFSSSALLELYSLNLGDPGYEMEQKASISSEHKFQKLVWSSGGILVGGCDGGLLKFYNVNNILNKNEALVSSNTKHTGSVSALDLNPFQNNLFSSGAADSEIFIWDLNNTSTPMAPGNKSQPNEHVQALAWNRQVQHILASSFSSRCVVWDLRKNEPIIKLCDGQARTRWKSAMWHPSVATQLCLASEDDLSPVIQLWDLRLATSPLLTLERHQKGVLALSWCQQDPDLLLSASKDGKVLCWNPNNNIPGGEVLSEICSTGQWVYDVQWCPKNPNLVAACSNDGRVGIYSINGGTHLQPVATSNKIMDSFPGMESFHQAPIPSMSEVQSSPQILPRPPQWTKRPMRATFGFGGKLVTFVNQSPVAGQTGIAPREVFISQVITEPELIEQARSLQEIINAGGSEGAAMLLTDYCIKKGDEAVDQHDKYIWHFLKASFDQNPRAEMLNLLGFRQDDMSNKMNNQFAKLNSKNQSNNIDGHIENLADRLSGLSRSESSETEAEPSTDTSTDISGVDAAAAFDNIAQANKINNDINAKPSVKPFVIPLGDDSEGLICQALLSGHIEVAVELCLDAGKTADALIIASAGGGDLLSRTQWRYLSRCTGPVSSLSSALLDGNWSDFASGVAASGWKAALAAALTHCSPTDLYTVCETLGEKLDKQSDPSLFRDATICYLCSASVEKLVARWKQELEVKGADAKLFTRIAELVLIVRLAAIHRGRPAQAAGGLSNLLVNYAMKLASQGYLDGALYCLSGLQDEELTFRLQCALGHSKPYAAATTQTAQRAAAPVQTQFSSRVRTSSYRSATQEPWNSVPQTNFMPNNVNQVPHYNPAAEQVTASQPSYGFTQPAQPPPQQPPRPPSASSHGGLIGGRNKYLRDPSVQSGMGGYQPGPIDTQPSFTPRQNAIQPGIPPLQPSYNNIQPLNPIQNSVPSVQTSFNTSHNYNSVQNPPPVQPLSNLMQPMPPAPINPISNPSFAPAPLNPTDMSNGINNNSYYNKPEMATEAMPNSYSQAPAGWNDPPALSSSQRSQNKMFAEHAGTRQWRKIIAHTHSHANDEPKQEFVPSAPITHPLYGTATPQHVPLSGPPQYQQDPMNQVPQGYGNMMPPNQPQMPNMAPNITNQQPPVENVVNTPPPPVQKPPIPEQHIHMQTVFDALRANCAQSINNPQIKRKLDDVQRKLETLYDLLRENRLSENAINVLHCVVQMVQSGDYGNSLNTLMSLASGPDFSAVASFLPSLKILIQTANNSQIYLR